MTDETLRRISLQNADQLVVGRPGPDRSSIPRRPGSGRSKFRRQFTPMSTWLSAGRILLVASAVTATAGCEDSPSPRPSPLPGQLTVARVEPNTGPTESAIPITIHGSGFLQGASVTWDGVLLPAAVVNASMITATVPPHAEGAVDLIVTNPGGANARLTPAYTYVPVRISSISPPAGFSSAAVQIAGTGFLAGASVTFDGVPAAPGRITATSIFVTAPVHGPGAVDVEVTNPGGQRAALAAGFTYTTPTLTVPQSEVGRDIEIVLNWTAPTPSSALDWIGLFIVGSANTEYLESHWIYTRAETSGAWKVRMPGQPGQYEFRYLLDDGYTDVARSSTVTVR